MTIDDLDEDTVYQSMSAIIDETTGAIPPEPDLDVDMFSEDNSPPVSPAHPTDYVDRYHALTIAPAPSVEDILASVERQLQRAPPPLGQYAHHPPDIVSVAYTGLTPDLVAFTRLPPNVVSLATLIDDPFFTVLHRAPDYAIICLPSGRIASCLLSDLDVVRSEYLAPLGREVLEFAPSPATAHPMSPATAPSPATAQSMSPANAPSPATAHSEPS